MRRTAPALLALTLMLVACSQSALPDAPAPHPVSSAAPAAVNESATGSPAASNPAVTNPVATNPAASNPATDSSTAPTAPQPAPGPTSSQLQPDLPPPQTATPVNPAPSAPAPPVPAPPTPVSAVEDGSLQPQSLTPSTFGGPVRVSGGTLRVGGQPMFPFGFYHVSWMTDAATRQRDMLEMSAAGFNTMTASVINDADNASYGTFLDAAARAHMYVLTEGLFGDAVPRLASKSAVLGWMVADDCNLQYSAAQVRARSEAVRALDPTHPTYAALFTSYGQPHADFFGATDLMGNMSYPIGPGDSIGSTYDMERLSVAEAARTGTVPIANLQTFSWGNVPEHDRSARMPTPAEVYNMTYQAIGAGVKGILYYTYLDSYNSVRRSPEVWNMVKSLVPELGQLSPMLLNAAPQYLNTNNGLIRATAWVYQKRTYLLISNVSTTATQPVYLPLPNLRPTMIRPLFAGRASGGLTLNGTTIGGSIAPLGANFYRID